LHETQGIHPDRGRGVRALSGYFPTLEAAAADPNQAEVMDLYHLPDHPQRIGEKGAWPLFQILTMLRK
jgi:hypothetical protein